MQRSPHHLVRGGAMGRGTAARRERRLEMRCTTAVARAAQRQPATAHELQPSTAVRRSGARAAQVTDEASATEEPRGVRRRAASPGTGRGPRTRRRRCVRDPRTAAMVERRSSRPAAPTERRPSATSNDDGGTTQCQCPVGGGSSSPTTRGGSSYLIFDECAPSSAK
ncbi:hypothetical protein PVAP13_7KG400370 [Panicum virgatum]|uniref:Uncharacterized protein n=1 Tax=Panicum virgatum TaxID=38727 RepID=A0A8T0QM17_PANVG|nr:hypothetical protein PVAP13_7KG400370 [Panicum virgatum]